MAEALGWELRDVMKATALAWDVVTTRGTGMSELPEVGAGGGGRRVEVPCRDLQTVC